MIEQNNFSLKLKKMGNRLIIYLPKKVRKGLKFNIGDNIKIYFKKRNEESISICRFNYIISVKKKIAKNLNLKEKDIVDVSIFQIKKAIRSKEMFRNDKIDLLYFVPDLTRKNSKIVVEEFDKASQRYLRMSSYHDRGSSSQIEIRRFLDSYLFGVFLGQMQSEGSKSFFDGLEFCNKSLQENKDFIAFLEYLGIPKNKIFTKVDYHISIENIQEEIEKFENFLNYKIDYESKGTKSRGGLGFKIIVRNTVLSETILNALEILRNYLVKEKWNKGVNSFADGFFSKLLNGDGSIEILTKNRNLPQARLKIYDGNLNYLEDYKCIMEKYGFTPYINKKYYYVRALCSPNLAKKLLLIGAFKDNPNLDKLKLLINSREKPPLSKEGSSD